VRRASAMTADRRTAALFAYVVLTGLSFVTVFPFLWMVMSSLKDATQIFHLDFFPTHPTLDNYAHLLLSRRSPFPRWFANSVIVAAVTTTSVLFFDSLLGYTLSKFDFPGKRVVFVLIVSTLMIPTEMLVIPWYTISVKLRWVDTYWGIMFPGMMSAFGVFLMRQFAAALPDELIAAARIDGLGEFRILITIAMPLLASAMATLAIFNFIGNWNAFIWPLIVASKPATFTLPVGLANFSGEAGSDWQLIMTGATISMVPLILVFLVFQRRIIRGIAMSGLRG
jgi:multiple sugar transport system permease protein